MGMFIYCIFIIFFAIFYTLIICLADFKLYLSTCEKYIDENNYMGVFMLVTNRFYITELQTTTDAHELLTKFNNIKGFWWKLFVTYYMFTFKEYIKYGTIRTAIWGTIFNIFYLPISLPVKYLFFILFTVPGLFFCHKILKMKLEIPLENTNKIKDDIRNIY